MKVHTECLVCSSRQLKQLNGYYDKHQLVKCRKCDFVFMERIPSAAELKDHYSSYSYSSEGYLSPITVKSYNLLLDEFEKRRGTNRILDVGCGRGWFLVEAKKRGWEVFGTEYSQKAIEHCEKANIKVLQGELSSSFFEENSFDVITSFEVIEHIYNPNKELDIISKLLRKGGLFYCTTPNFNSLMRFYLKENYNVIGYPEHLSYYTKSTLNRLVKNNRLKPLKFGSTGISITRIKTSSKKSSEKLISHHSSDEILRRNIENKWYLQFVKYLVNRILTFTNTGMTLKGYYVKV